MVRRLLLILALIVIPALSRADGVLDSILGGLKTLPDVKEGVFIDVEGHKALNTLGLEVVNAGYFGKYWSNVTVDLNYIGQDGLGGSINLNLGAIGSSTMPINKYLQYLSLGYGFGWRTLTDDNTGGSNPASDNRFIQGPIVLAKLHF